MRNRLYQSLTDPRDATGAAGKMRISLTPVDVHRPRRVTCASRPPDGSCGAIVVEGFIEQSGGGLTISGRPGVVVTLYLPIPADVLPEAP